MVQRDPVSELNGRRGERFRVVGTRHYFFGMGGKSLDVQERYSPNEGGEGVIAGDGVLLSCWIVKARNLKDVRRAAAWRQNIQSTRG